MHPTEAKHLWGNTEANLNRSYYIYIYIMFIDIIIDIIPRASSSV